ncbi:TonB-dependent receptor [Desulfobacterales bacterium HSG16]|nr:TonB-dependent receptor [Desulfobacterales bacterium HSG16]
MPDSILDDELQWIEEESFVYTEIATRTKMDADLVPGMVTVLKGKDLEERGARTVFEALALVPGLHTSIDSSGGRSVSVRGIGGSFFSGNLKILLDDIVVNDTLSSGGEVIYEIPVELIDRIEIIRGPGSIIYGEYAYAGVINVKTIKDGNRVYGSLRADDNSIYGYGGGGTLTYTNPEKKLILNANFSGWKSDGPDVTAGNDRLTSGFGPGMEFPDYSYSPGPTNEAEEDKLLGVFFKYKDFSISGQYLSNKKGDYFGLINALPRPEDDANSLDKHLALEARQGVTLPNSLTLDLKAGLREYEFHLDKLLGLPPILNATMTLPDGSVINIGDVTPVDGSIAGPYYDEREIYAGAELIWEGLERHTLLLGMKYSEIEMGDVWVDANTDDDSFGVMTRLTGSKSWLDLDKRREVFSIYLQEMFDITDYFTLTAGLRFDHYDNHDKNNYDALTPRLSAVYRLTNNHILKAQYSEAVRPPAFTELYSKENSVIGGDPSLEPETIKSYELGYIYRKMSTSFRATLFYSELEDNIQYPKYADPFGGVGIHYLNADDKIKTKGFELEFAHDLQKDLRLNLNLSFADTNDEDDNSLEKSTDWLGNAGLLYRFLENYSLALDYRYVGKRHRTPDDDRDELDAYNTVNLTANVYNLFTKGLTFHAGVKNMFDSSIIYPAPIFKNTDTDIIGYTYKDDLPRPGREWWFQVSYDF